MLNFDKYREQIDKWLETEKPLCNFRYALEKNICPNMMCDECREDTFKWLFTEYEQPLLENGDELKPGDWIMVRDVDSQSFVKRQFLYFFDGKFICSAPNHAPLEGFGEPWVQARLLEDGEE